MKTERSILADVGDRLLEYSKEGDFTAQRSLIGELFPYIFLASRRMSARAISRWLETEEGIKISDVAVARALRNSKKHWRDLVDNVEPAARVFGAAHDMSVAGVLDAPEDLFESLAAGTPTLNSDSNGDMWDSLAEYEDAAHTLRHCWYIYPDAVRAECRPFFGTLDIRKALKKGKKKGGQA